MACARRSSSAQDLAPAVGIDADGHNDGDRDDAAVLPDLHVGGIDPQVRPIALDRPVEEGPDPLVDLFAQPRDPSASLRAGLALRYPAPAHDLDQVIDRPGRDALDVDPMGQTG